MDIQQAFSIVTERIMKLEPPDLATRIVGYLLFYYGGEEMIRLAHYPDQTIEKVVLLMKNKFPSLVNDHLGPPISPHLSQEPVGDLIPVFHSCSPPDFSPPVVVGRPMPNRDALVFPDQNLSSYHDVLTEIQNKTPCLSLVDSYDQGTRGRSNHFVEEGQRPNFVKKICHYFSTGPCKKGNSCRYIHELPSPKHFVTDEHFLPGSHKMLEMEIIELLKMNGGEPIEIASLPSVYSVVYGKPWEGNGYQTERQRIVLLKLLGRMKSSIRILDRPNGQPSIILAENLGRYSEYRSRRNSPGCKQIYLTFPKESTFTEDDVARYFSKFGDVKDVRIPNQTERMFGFVTFSNSETVDQLLSMHIHHFVGETGVLVKPYRDISNRRNMETLVSNPRQYANVDYEFVPTPRRHLEAARLLRREQQVEQYIDGQRHIEFQLAQNNAELPDSLDNHFPVDGVANNYSNLDSAQEIRLPDSLTTSPISKSITSTTSADPHQQ